MVSNIQKINAFWSQVVKEWISFGLKYSKNESSFGLKYLENESFLVSSSQKMNLIWSQRFKKWISFGLKYLKNESLLFPIIERYYICLPHRKKKWIHTISNLYHYDRLGPQDGNHTFQSICKYYLMGTMSMILVQSLEPHVTVSDSRLLSVL